MNSKKICQINLPTVIPFMIVIFALTSLLVSGFSTNTLAAEPMKIVYFKDYSPLSWSGSNQEEPQMRGILIDILNEALKKRMHINITHKGLLWEEAQIMVKNGEADAFVTIPTPERRTYTRISREPVVNSRIKIFTSKNSPRIKALANVRSYPELKPFKLVDYQGNGRAEETLKGLDVHWLATMDEIPHFLISGKADAWTQNIFVARFFLKHNGDKGKIIELANTLSSESFHLCIGKKSLFVNILDLFDQTIKDMKKDGTLDKIYNNYQ